jgi:hypothetical protein
MLRTVLALGLTCLAALAVWGSARAEEPAPTGNPTEGRGLRLAVREQERLPDGEAWRESFETMDIDFGKDLDPRKARSYEVWLTYALATNPDAAKEEEQGWTAAPPQRVAILRGVVLADKQAKGGQQTGFHLGVYRARMDDAAVKRAKALGEAARVLKIEVRETKRRDDGTFDNDKAFEDPQPVLVRKVGVATVEGGNDVLMYLRPVHPDSKEGKAQAEKEAAATGGRRGDARSFRAVLDIRREIRRMPDGRYGQPGEVPGAPTEDAAPAK